MTKVSKSGRLNYFVFYVLGDQPQLAERGEGDLVRLPVGATPSWAQALRLGSAEWYETDTLGDESRSGDHTFTEITKERARRIVQSWFDMGRLPKLPDLEWVAPGSELEDRLTGHELESANYLGQPMTPDLRWQWYLAGTSSWLPKLIHSDRSRIYRRPVGAPAVFAEMVSKDLARGTFQLDWIIKGGSQEHVVEISRKKVEEVFEKWRGSGRVQRMPDLDGGMTPVVADWVTDRLAQNGYPGELVLSADSRADAPRFDWRPLSVAM